MGAMAYEHHVRVRYGETDQMGVVHHANYLLYMEEARTTLMRDRGCSYGELEKQGIGLPVRRCDLRFRASACYEDELLVRVSVVKMRAASVTFAYEIERRSDGAALVSATLELACVDMAATPRKPRMLPAELRELFEATQAEAN